MISYTNLIRISLNRKHLKFGETAALPAWLPQIISKS